MCDIHVYILNKDKKEELILENAEQVTDQGGSIRILNIFGEEKILKARLHYYNNSEKKMVFAPV